MYSAKQNTLVAFAAIAIASLSLLSPLTVRAQATYPKIEASFLVNTAIADPFDYSNNVRVTIIQPNSSVISLPAFFDGGTTWRVRHTPTLSGTYTVSGITLKGSPLSFSNLQPASWTVTGFPTNAGFVQLDPANPRRFITSNGRRFFPVGENVAWSYSSSDALNILPKMGAAHENWARIWMTHFYDNGTTYGLNLDWPKVNNTFGQLSLTNSHHWDAIIAAAEQAGVHVQVTLQHHGQYSSTNGSDVNPNWEQNPYNVANGGFLSYATNFFTDPTAIALTKRKLAYSVARWGYSTSVMGWELFNEVQFTDAAYSNQWSNIEAWHNQMATFLRSQDLYHHLITSSSDLTKPIWDQTDYYQHHDYPTDLIAGIQGAPDITASQTNGPDYSGECGIDTTPHVGLSPPIWAGLMAGQSGGAQPWYWDTIDPNNDYFLIQAAGDFVTASGLADQNALTKSTPATTGGTSGPLTFSFGGGFNAAAQDTFTVGTTTPSAAAATPPYLQGNYHRSYTPNGYTFNVNYPQSGTFSVQITGIAQSGAGLEIFLDGNVKTNLSFPSTSANVSTNLIVSIPVSSGAHTLNLSNPGLDWVLLGSFTFNPYVPALSAYALGTNNWQALWLWNVTNVFSASPGPSVAGTVSLASLDPGTYAGVWWDTFGAGAISNFTFTVTNANTPVALSTPAILRSMALYVGLPARAGITAPGLAQIVYSNYPPVTLPLSLTNSGTVPLSYSLSFTNALPAWLSLSSTNGTVSKTSALTLLLALNTSGLVAGTYHFTLFLNTSDATQPVTVLPLSITVSASPPPAPLLSILSENATNIVLQLQGLTNIPYTLQTSTNLITWTSLSTNTLPNGTLTLTNPISAGTPQQFFRAFWLP